MAIVQTVSVNPLQRQLDELDQSISHHALLGEINCHLARHGLRLIKRGEARDQFVWIRLEGWNKRRLVFVKPLTAIGKQQSAIGQQRPTAIGNRQSAIGQQRLTTLADSR